MPTFDVVCASRIDESTAEENNRFTTYRRTTFHFCSVECEREFISNPTAYVYPYSGRGATGRSVSRAKIGMPAVADVNRKQKVRAPAE
jgi:YHS domain-containing protein